MSVQRSNLCYITLQDGRHPLDGGLDSVVDEHQLI